MSEEMPATNRDWIVQRGFKDYCRQGAIDAEGSIEDYYESCEDEFFQGQLDIYAHMGNYIAPMIRQLMQDKKLIAPQNEADRAYNEAIDICSDLIMKTEE